MCVGPGPGVKVVLAARRRRPSSSRSPAVTGGSRESVTGWMSGGRVVWALETRESAASNSTDDRILINFLLCVTTSEIQRLSMPCRPHGMLGAILRQADVKVDESKVDDHVA